MDAEFRQAIETAERFADGACSADALRGQDYNLWDLVRDNRYGFHRRGLPAGVDEALMALTAVVVSSEWAGRVSARSLRPLVRCVFGNPTVTFDLAPLMRSPVVRSLAQATYDERNMPRGTLDPIRLGILADALEEAGGPAEMLEHLRSPGKHVRGCWGVDLCLRGP
jgi:hypothetical protein